MYVSFNNGSKQKRELTESLSEYVASKIMPRLNQKIFIHFEFVRNLVKDESVYGDCMYIDDDIRLHREFLIRLDSGITMQRLLLTVAHEMVHVKQYARNELCSVYKMGKIRFKNKYFSFNTIYWDTPWEIEAHGREQGLYIQWLERNKLTKRKWVNNEH
jgi:hypothetical protein